ncbi:MAG TPA: M28 family peptidase [Gaiellaceae bacterium]|nr:M28 family peptidase [Gaiellaceae bacterium]
MAGTIRLLAAGLLAASVLAGTASGDTASGSALKLRKAITLQGMKRHEQALQAIANANGGIRAAGTPGFDASVAYVVAQLEDAGYDPVVQSFEFPFFQELAPPTLALTAPAAKTYAAGTDFATMTYSGGDDVTGAVEETAGNLFPPPPTPGSSAGCEASDFAGFTAGNVALIQRGTCTFHDKALNAQNAGASAVLIFNEGQPGRTAVINGTLGSPDFTIPVLGTTFALGQELHDLLVSGPVSVHVATSTISETRTAANVLADAPGGDPDHVVVQGSHLDSVTTGPGINDNGSGSSYNLESAIQIAENNVKTRNKIRFAWWGAEEEGLLGSQFYVDSLSDDEFATIAGNLNFDMIASPNFVRFVYDGDGSDTPTAGPPGSAEIEQIFLDWFASAGLASAPTAFDGRSDYGPFIARGAPAGGLFTGAEGVKTEEQAGVYGGVAGEAYDRCYHQACDTASNLSDTAFDQMADAAATALVTLGESKPAKTKPLSAAAARAHAAEAVFRGPRTQR